MSCLYQTTEIINACGGPRKYRYCNFPRMLQIKNLCVKSVCPMTDKCPKCGKKFTQGSVEHGRYRYYCEACDLLINYFPFSEKKEKKKGALDKWI